MNNLAQLFTQDLLKLDTLSKEEGLKITVKQISKLIDLYHTQNHKPSPERKEFAAKVYAEYQKGYGLTELEQIFGLHRTTLFYLLQEFNYKLRPKGGGARVEQKRLRGMQ